MNPMPIQCDDKRLSFSFYWTDKLGLAINRRSVEPYPCEFHKGSEFNAIMAAINQGIDSHLEAIFFKQEQGDYGRVRLIFEAASMAVLVRRLMESGDEAAELLASGICETLNIELI